MSILNVIIVGAGESDLPETGLKIIKVEILCGLYLSSFRSPMSPRKVIRLGIWEGMIEYSSMNNRKMKSFSMSALDKGAG